MLLDDEVGEPTLSEFADKLRSRAGQLMRTHPAAATHLVLAAASIAPTCPHEQLVAEHCAAHAAARQPTSPTHRSAEAAVTEASRWSLMIATTCASDPPEPVQPNPTSLTRESVECGTLPLSYWPASCWPP